METTTTKGIKISVETLYKKEYSDQENDKHVFAYRVTIENQNDFTVQLLRRHWLIFDSNGAKREVEGEGVIGLQPVINPGASHQYTSGCSLDSDIGTMQGTYLIERISDNSLFRVRIPEFQLIAPHRLN